jgi:hypothetical protein
VVALCVDQRFTSDVGGWIEAGVFRGSCFWSLRVLCVVTVDMRLGRFVFVWERWKEGEWKVIERSHDS